MNPTQTSERSPLLRQDTARPKAPRNVTFNANPVSRTISPAPASLSSSPTPNPRDLALNRSRSTPGIPTTTAAVATSTGTPPMLSALNSRLRRRNSHGSAAGFTSLPPSIGPLPKIGPQRSSKTAQKLKLLPAPDEDGEFDEESGRDVYSQFTRIKDPTARRDAARLGKADRDRLPRVTAYCTANKYKIEDLMRFLKGKSKARGANPKLIDECIYSPYNYNGKNAQRQENSYYMVENTGQYDQERRHSTGQFEEASESQRRENDLIDLREEHKQHEHDSRDVSTSAVEQSQSYSNGRDVNNNLAYPDHSEHEQAVVEEHSNSHMRQDPDFDTQVHTPEVFIFDYGVVVIWGMTLAHEQRFLKDIAKFELDKLETDDVETECFNFYYTREYQPRIYNDFITLRDKGNYMTKLAISHALAQSVKTSLFEEMIASTVDECKDIPTQIAMTGKIALSRKEINMQIGELFILRINIHLNGSVLDTPELFWVEPHLEPVYRAVRSYLEMDQRVGLLTERLDVIADLLAVLKDQLSHGHGEMLEWIVIILIAAEILVAAINIVVDLYAGVD